MYVKEWLNNYKAQISFKESKCALQKYSVGTKICSTKILITGT